MIGIDGANPSHATSGSKAWMVIFTDLVSLLLTFFVMLFSMSNLKVDNWDEMIDTLSQSFSPNSEKIYEPATAKHNISSTFRKRAINLDYLAAVLSDAVAGDPLLEQSRLLRTEDRLIVALPGSQWFQPGKAELTQRGKEALFQLGSVLRNVGNELGVSGHAGILPDILPDNLPGAGGEFESGWGLSLARAVAVGNALGQAGHEGDIVTFGYSDSRVSQLIGLTPEQRKVLGERVDIIIMPHEGKDQ